MRKERGRRRCEIFEVFGRMFPCSLVLGVCTLGQRDRWIENDCNKLIVLKRTPYACTRQEKMEIREHDDDGRQGAENYMTAAQIFCTSVVGTSCAASALADISSSSLRPVSN